MASPRAREGQAPRLYTVPPTAPFLDTLARAVLAGDLPAPGGTPPAALDLPGWTILLPTRRACRALREAFLAAAGSQAAMLPRIRPIGDIDEEEGFFAEAGDLEQGELALELPPAIGDLERRLILSELVLAWSRTRAERGQAGDLFATLPPAATPAQAVNLAGALARLMDAVDNEQADLSRLAELVPDRFAAHWQDTVEFLTIVTEHWPRVLRERGRMPPYARRNALIEAESERLRRNQPALPVIAAGSTGSVPVTAGLLKVIAGLPTGAVVLPGLDLAMDEDDWKAIDADHPEHPQFGMKELLARMDAERSDVSYLPGAEPDIAERARLELVAETLRPAASTDKWRAFTERADPAAMHAALADLELVEAPTAQDEAEAIALMLRRAAEEPGRTAALVTPDRTLARRVAARLEKWDLTVDDSAGRPLAKTPPGAFLDLVIETAAGGFEPVPLLALLKHPLARLGCPAAALKGAARTLELAAFRQPVLGAGLGGARAALTRARKEVEGGRSHQPALARIQRQDWDAAASLIADLEAAFAPLTTLMDAPSAGLQALAKAHAETAQALARDETGSYGALWRGEAGEALALLFAELLAPADHDMALRPGDYPDVYRALLGARVVRPQRPAHPRLSIWGPLEARLQQADTIILGGLNDGTWPRHEETDPWLNRAMQADIGLAPPERRTGLSAHDFAQLMGARKVVLARAAKVDGVPTVPSRWLLRLTALLDGLGLDGALKRGHDWLAWARERDSVEHYLRIDPPAPCPPLEARPRRLSVTRIEEWIANPYAIYARDILQLVPLDALAGEPDAALRGSLIHDVMSRFAREHPERLPTDIHSEVMRIANALFDEYDAHPRVRAFWRPQFARFALWFAATEPARRDGVARVLAEVAGRLAIDGARTFQLTARADRIDVRQDGSLAVYDYKTGGVPSSKQVDGLWAPQLPLEAAIASAGGFKDVPAGPVAHLRYIRILGRGDEAGEEREAGAATPASLGAAALGELKALIAMFDHPATPYVVLRRRPFLSRYRYDAYEHLARLREWASAGDGEEAP